jgi:hypothetical protein
VSVHSVWSVAVAVILGVTACSSNDAGPASTAVDDGTTATSSAPGDTTGGESGGAPAFPMDTKDALVSVLGPPDAYSAKVVVLDDGEATVETHTYADLSTRFDIVDGLVVGSEAVEPYPDGTLLPLHVSVLRLGMTEAEVRDSLIGVELTEVDGVALDMPAGSSVLAGGQVLICLFDDRVVYLQTYPLVPDDDGAFQAYLESDEP